MHKSLVVTVLQRRRAKVPLPQPTVGSIRRRPQEVRRAAREGRYEPRAHMPYGAAAHTCESHAARAHKRARKHTRPTHARHIQPPPRLPHQVFVVHYAPQPWSGAYRLPQPHLHAPVFHRVHLQPHALPACCTARAAASFTSPLSIPLHLTSSPSCRATSLSEAPCCAHLRAARSMSPLRTASALRVSRTTPLPLSAHRRRSPAVPSSLSS